MWTAIPHSFHISSTSPTNFKNATVTKRDFPHQGLPSLTMASQSPEDRLDLAESSLTMPSDSENYSANNELSSPSPSPRSSSSSPMILYSPPTIWGLLRGAAINLLLPFINGLMLGFGELLAHEAAFRLGWSGTKVNIVPHSLFLLAQRQLRRISCGSRSDVLLDKATGWT